jgi:hypothetical protein
MNYLTVISSVYVVAHSLKRDIHGYGGLRLGRKPRDRMKNNQPKSGRIRVSLTLSRLLMVVPIEIVSLEIPVI